MEAGGVGFGAGPSGLMAGHGGRACEGACGGAGGAAVLFCRKSQAVLSRACAVERGQRAGGKGASYTWLCEVCSVVRPPFRGPPSRLDAKGTQSRRGASTVY